MQGFVLAPVPARPGILTYSTASGDIMEISFRFKEKNNLIYYAVFLGIGILLTVLAQASFRPLVLFAILYFFICSMRVRLSDKLPWLWTGILFTAFWIRSPLKKHQTEPFFSMFSVWRLFILSAT